MSTLYGPSFAFKFIKKVLGQDKDGYEKRARVLQLTRSLSPLKISRLLSISKSKTYKAKPKRPLSVSLDITIIKVTAHPILNTSLLVISDFQQVKILKLRYNR